MIRVSVAALFAASLCFADTYPRQPAIQPVHYAFHLTLDDSTEKIVGAAEIEVRFVKSADSFWLDFGKGMSVSAVTCNDPVHFEKAPDRLVIHMEKAAEAGELERCTVRYEGVAKAGLHIGPNRYGERTVFSDSWPNKAHEWLPVIDHPSAKATSEFFVTAPAKYQVVSNGRLVEETDLGDGTRLTHWSQAIPIAPWLNALGMAQFTSRHFGSVAGVPLETWVYHQDRKAGISGFEGPIREAMEFYVDHIGPFPYEKIANVEAMGVQGGMELASAIFYGEKAFDGKLQRDLVAHEIAHQWFGDSVTENDWDDVWLSEGFATYFTHLTALHYRGREAFVAGLKRDREVVFNAEQKDPTTAIIHNNLSDMSRVLNRLVYQKAGWVLHMLHSRIGDDAFWTGIRSYYARYRDRNATTADFRRVMEEASGSDLKPFFEQWLRRPGSPEIRAVWIYNVAAKAIEFDVEQNTAFAVPLEIGIDSADSRHIETVHLSKTREKFQFPCPTVPAGVVLDPETKLLARITLVKARE